MTRFALRFASAAASVAAAVVLSSASASAAPVDAATYGQHVRECTQSMGFHQDHHPGMHRGLSGWDPAHTC